jgi:KTSC domain-containing protein
MERRPVQSRSLASVGYDRDTLVLETEFRNGRVYQYFAVPANSYEAFIASESLGKHFNENIRNTYDFRRIK